MDTKVIEKIQKLLALSESSNENEAHAAMLRAQALLAKHKLSLKEVKEAFNQITFARDTKIKTQFCGYSVIYRQGYKDGEAFSTADRLAEGEASIK